MMGVTIVVVAAYVGARSLRSAAVLGWFLVPLGAMAVIGLWTPLVLGLVPTGVVVAIALLKRNRWLGIAWLVAAAAIAAFMGLTQLSAILGVEPGQSTGDFTTEIGAVGTGMVPFNLGMALAAPVIAILVVVLLVRARRWPLAVAVVGPILGAAAVAAVLRDRLGRRRHQPPAVVLRAQAPRRRPARHRRAGRGPRRGRGGARGRRPAARLGRHRGRAGGRDPRRLLRLRRRPALARVRQPVGGAGRPGGCRPHARDRGPARSARPSSAAQQAAVPYPDDTTLLWDGAGTLPNLWVASLHGVHVEVAAALLPRPAVVPLRREDARLRRSRR